MTPKQKAKELVDKFTDYEIEIGGQHDGYLFMQIHDAKQCALICVDEIMHVIDWHEFETPNEELNYWNQVKEEIQKL